MNKEKRKMIYRRIKILKPFCNVCDKQIHGNGSLNDPYFCDCGEWKYDTEKFNWYIKND